MSSPAELQCWLGHATEARLAAAFAHGLVITAKAAADLIDVDEKTLKSMTEAGLIRAVRRGSLPAYTELDIRAYLLECPQPCRDAKDRPAPPARSGKVIPFSERRTRSR